MSNLDFLIGQTLTIVVAKSGKRFVSVFPNITLSETKI